MCGLHPQEECCQGACKRGEGGGGRGSGGEHKARNPPLRASTKHLPEQQHPQHWDYGRKQGWGQGGREVGPEEAAAAAFDRLLGLVLHCCLTHMQVLMHT